jgi:hypothetical protein
MIVAALVGLAAAIWAGTALTRYCPLNQAVGRDTYHDESPLEQGRRDTQRRRHTAVHGVPPSAEAGQPRVTPDSDVFGGTERRHARSPRAGPRPPTPRPEPRRP